jgi:hypothetical protein
MQTETHKSFSNFQKMLECHVPSGIGITTGIRSAPRIVGKAYNLTAISSVKKGFDLPLFERLAKKTQFCSLGEGPVSHYSRRLYCGASPEPVYAFHHEKWPLKSVNQWHETTYPGWKARTNADFKCIIMTLLALATVWSSGRIAYADDLVDLKAPGQISTSVIKNSILRYGNYCGPGPAEVSPANDCNAVQGLPTVDDVDRQVTLHTDCTVCIAPASFF